MNAVMVNAQAAFNAIAAEVTEVLERRDNLIATTQAELAAIGVDSVVSDQSQGHPLEAGQTVRVWRDIRPWRTGEILVRPVLPDERWGPYRLCEDWVQDALGSYLVLIADHDKVLLVADSEPSEAQYRRAIARLRRLAKEELMRVRVHDRSVQIVSPFGDVVHEGDVTTAFCWLSGIEMTEAHA